MAKLMVTYMVNGFDGPAIHEHVIELKCSAPVAVRQLIKKGFSKDGYCKVTVTPGAILEIQELEE